MEFELSRNIIIGQYLPTGSLVHRLDPRTKIIGTACLLLAVSFSRSLIGSFILFGIIVGIVLASRISLGYLLRTVKNGLPIILIFTVLAQLYLGWQEPAGRVYFEWGWIRITRNAMQLGALSLLRLLSFVLLVSLPSLTTQVTHLTHGIEYLLMPFRRLGVPAHEIALINMISLRFVPTLAMELETVAKAQASRLGQIGSAGRRPDKLARSLLPLVVPLFVNAFRRAEELAMAMDARGYMGGAGRTKFVSLKATPLDVALSIGMVLICVAALFVPWPALNQWLSVL